jgi:hypothetical protein
VIAEEPHRPRIDRSVRRSPCARRSDRPKHRRTSLRASVCRTEAHQPLPGCLTRRSLTGNHPLHLPSLERRAVPADSPLWVGGVYGTRRHHDIRRPEASGGAMLCPRRSPLEDLVGAPSRPIARVTAVPLSVRAPSPSGTVFSPGRVSGRGRDPTPSTGGRLGPSVCRAQARRRTGRAGAR